MENNQVEPNYPPSVYGDSPHQEEDQYEDNAVKNEVVEDDESADEEDENEHDDSGFSSLHDDDSFQDEDDSDIDDEDDEENGVEDGKPAETERPPKKRRLKNLISKYIFAPRLPASSPAAPSVSKPSFGSRNSLTYGTEHDTRVLLDAWGKQQGRKSLRSEDWQQVAKKVSEVSKTERTDIQCRYRLDTTKNKYRKEKTRLKEASPPQQDQGGLSSVLDAGEFVFTNPEAYLMRDSPGNSNSAGEEDSDELPPKRAKNARNNEHRSPAPSPYKVLADSILNFSNIYEKVERTRRQHMNELEKMRMSFHKEIEIQKKQLMERARIEITKILQLGDKDSDVSP